MLALSIREPFARRETGRSWFLVPGPNRVVRFDGEAPDLLFDRKLAVVTTLFMYFCGSRPWRCAEPAQVRVTHGGFIVSDEEPVTSGAMVDLLNGLNKRADENLVSLVE
jgi:hypothetical protein